MAACPKTSDELVTHLETELFEVPHIAWTDVDLSTGELIVVLGNGSRFAMQIPAIVDVE